ncbi:MAG: hypothetical protein ABSD41_09260 [Candidatus Bathyarchaeia archaeon]|jgi:hypothetical protein
MHSLNEASSDDLEMTMNFEELDQKTRKYMLDEFEAEETCGKPYRSKDLSNEGLAAFPSLMRDAISNPNGNEETLAASLVKQSYWKRSENVVRKSRAYPREIDPRVAAERLAISEFNTWYVHGFAKRLMDEGVTQCQVYRASIPKHAPAECSKHENQVFSVVEIYHGHRARYWPEPGNHEAFSIPFNPNCHHSIRRVPSVS